MPTQRHHLNSLKEAPESSFKRTISIPTKTKNLHSISPYKDQPKALVTQLSPQVIIAMYQVFCSRETVECHRR